MWRPLNGQARYRFVLDGLYLAGSGAHPGGGITGGPGANAARQILRDLKKASQSSSVIVPSPMPEPAIVALVGLDRFTE